MRLIHITSILQGLFYYQQKSIIVLKNDISVSQLWSHISEFQHIPHTDAFEINGIRGYTTYLSQKQINQFSLNPLVDYIEQDQILHHYETEYDAPWGLVRISHHQTGNHQDFTYKNTDGEGVTAYVIDTGIYSEHEEFGGRATYGKNFVGRNAKDQNGHGTHCSAILAGAKYGVAKKAKVVGVRVLDANGSGSTSGVLRGIEWVVNQHKSNPKSKSIASMSLGGSFSRVLNTAVNNAVDAGVFFVVAAGNEKNDACFSSPASASNAITVGATDIDDNLAWFSNTGTCVDVLAPGVDILSAWIGHKKATNKISGTSMATPFVGGVVASLLSRPKYANFTPFEMKKELFRSSTKGVIAMEFGLSDDTPNRLLFSKPPKEAVNSEDL